MLGYPLSFAAGLLTALSPCVLPALPFVVASAGQRARGAPLALAGGLIVSFVAVGMTLSLVGDALGVSEAAIRYGAAWIMIAAAMVLFIPRLQDAAARLFSPLASRAAGAGQQIDGGDRGLRGQFLSGLLLGAVWSPCVGPTLAAAVGLAAQTETAAQAALMMTLFGVGASLPLLFAAYAGQRVFGRYRDALMARAAVGKKLLAVGLLAVGVAVLAGLDKRLEAAVLDLLPNWWVELTTRF
jgi:cytochrome c-type biogenesis protein